MEPQRGIAAPRPQLSTQVLERQPFPRLEGIVQSINHRQLEVADAAPGFQREKCPRLVERDDGHPRQASNDHGIDDDQ
jgi:hypothetical protein